MCPAELGEKGEEGSKLCKYTAALMLHSSILRMRRSPKKKECREKRRFSKVLVPKMMERSWPEDKGSQLSPGCQNVLL